MTTGFFETVRSSDGDRVPQGGTRISCVTIRPPGAERIGLAEIWVYRELLYFFLWADVKGRFKQSIVGFGWAFVQPVFTMIVFTLFFGRLAKIPSDGIPHPVFYYCALLPWAFFSSSVTGVTSSLAGNAALFTKVYFPRLILPIRSVLNKLVDFGLSLLILLALIGYYIYKGEGISLGPRALLLPLFLALAIVSSLGVGLWLAPGQAKYRDVAQVVTFALQFWMFASPVAYSSSLVPARWRTLYRLNPMVEVIDGFRWSLTGKGQRPGPMLAFVAVAMVALMLIGALRFRRAEGTAADVV